MRQPFPRSHADENLLLLLRHGATANNTANPPRLQGRGSDMPLSEIGREQARRTAEFLADRAIDAVYASPLSRAVETAEAIAAPHGLTVSRVAEFIECDVGAWEGLSWAEVAAASPDEHRRFLADPAAHSYAGGESLRQVFERAAPALDRLLRGGTGRTIVVVAHNVVNRVVLAPLLGVPLSLARGIPQANCGINVLRHGGGRTKLLTLNGVWHLPEWE